MTWPEYLAGSCRLDGKLTRLTLQEADLLLALLLADPDQLTPTKHLLESVWPNPDQQPITASRAISVIAIRLRRRGIGIENRFKWGFRIPRLARGRQDYAASETTRSISRA